MAAVQQMIGRAGRPQFDTLGRVVILTQSSTRHLYAALVDPTNAAGAGAASTVESNLKENMIGHLNAEIVLGTITDAVRGIAAACRLHHVHPHANFVRASHVVRMFIVST